MRKDAGRGGGGGEKGEQRKGSGRGSDRRQVDDPGNSVSSRIAFCQGKCVSAPVDYSLCNGKTRFESNATHRDDTRGLIRVVLSLFMRSSFIFVIIVILAYLLYYIFLYNFSPINISYLNNLRIEQYSNSYFLRQMSVHMKNTKDKYFSQISQLSMSMCRFRSEPLIQIL